MTIIIAVQNPLDIRIIIYIQTVQVSRFQRDPPDFTRSVPLPDVLPSGILKIPRSSSQLAHYYNEVWQGVA